MTGSINKKEEKKIVMSQKEFLRLPIFIKILENKLTQKDAVKILPIEKVPLFESFRQKIRRSKNNLLRSRRKNK